MWKKDWKNDIYEGNLWKIDIGRCSVQEIAGDGRILDVVSKKNKENIGVPVAVGIKLLMTVK